MLRKKARARRALKARWRTPTIAFLLQHHERIKRCLAAERLSPSLARLTHSDPVSTALQITFAAAPAIREQRSPMNRSAHKRIPPATRRRALERLDASRRRKMTGQTGRVVGLRAVAEKSNSTVARQSG